MAQSKVFAENYYSFRTFIPFLTTSGDTLDDQSAEIAEELEAAHQSYYAQQYQKAIQHYQKAQALLRAIIEPIPSSFYRGLSDGGAQMDVFLSASLERLNLMQVTLPLATARPRVVEHSLQIAQPQPMVGLYSKAVATPKSVKVVADWNLGRHYQKDGNMRAAEFFTTRARTADAALFKLLEESITSAPALGGASSAPEENGVDGQVLGAPPFPGVLTTLGSAISRRTSLARRTPATVSLPRSLTGERVLNVRSGKQVASFTWSTSDPPPLEKVRAAVYDIRVVASELVELQRAPEAASDVVIGQAHDYYYVVPLGLAESYHALGEYSTAEQHYFAAAKYKYLSTKIEAPYLFRRLCELYRDWGNSLFLTERPAEALPIYERVLKLDASLPVSTLYTTAALKPGADMARQVIANLHTIGLATKVNDLQQSGKTRDQALADPAVTAKFGTLKKLGHDVTSASLAPVENLAKQVNPVLTAVIKDIHKQLNKIKGGLNIFGYRSDLIPIHTFDYLQSVAINFAQLAINAERDMIGYYDRFDQELLDVQQLVQAIYQAKAEANVAQQQEEATWAAYAAAVAGVWTASQRSKNAEANAKVYEKLSPFWIQLQALGQQMAGGDGANYNLLNSIADQLLAQPATGVPFVAPIGYKDLLGAPFPIWASSALLAASGGLAASQLQRDYEQMVLYGQSKELQAALSQAEQESRAALARAEVATAAADAAELRVTSAKQQLDWFSNQYFEFDVWYRLGEAMKTLYHHYLDMALDVAQLMEQAYNFQHDSNIRQIRNSYLTGEGIVSTKRIGSLLGAEQLMADIQSFSHRQVTDHHGKPQPLKHTISLAERYPYLFESQFRKTGVMEFATTIEDFDEYYPGTYAGRIEAIEIEVDGMIPVRGISGTLTCGGVSAYRTPTSLWIDPKSNGLKYRIQPAETLVLSDYAARADALLIVPDQRKLKIFQGAGLASLWRLELPKGINDIDYGALTDVRITFYYNARFDPDLAKRVRDKLAATPGINKRQRGLPLRWLYPDAFFHFQDTGELRLNLRAIDFRANETKPLLETVGLLIVTDGKAPASGVAVTLSTPGKQPIAAKTGAGGELLSEGAPPLAPLAGGTALGDYTISVPDAARRARIVNIALLLGYSFTPRS